MFQITALTLFLSLSPVRMSSHIPKWKKKKNWNNKYHIYVIFHGARERENTVYIRIQVQMWESGYEYITSRMQIIELKMRLNIQFDCYAYDPGEMIDVLPSLPTFFFLLLCSHSKPEKYVYSTQFFSNSLLKVCSWNVLTILLLAIACKWTFVFISFPIERLKRVRRAPFIL